MARRPILGYNGGVDSQPPALISQRIACLTLDVEADHHDLTLRRHAQALEHQATWQWLLAFSRQHDLPWTVFVVGELLETHPGLAQRLAASGWELGLHSFSHDPRQPDTLHEIWRGKAAFRAAFGRDPAGYRAPVGNITPQGLQRLAAEGFTYDASVFPTWHPGKANHLAWPTQPYLVDVEPALVEIPFAVIPRLRLIASVSFVKLLGMGAYRRLLSRFGLPTVAVIDCHMHDLAPAPDAYGELPFFWKQVYRRNRDQGQAALIWLVNWLAAAGYVFWTVGAVAGLLRQEAGHG